VGEQEPAYLKYPQAAPLFVKNFEGQMVDSTRKTRTQGIATLFKVPVEKIDGQPAYYRIYRENGWLAAASVRKLSQYALAELGFITLDKAPESFDLIDGSTHPDNVVKGILERLYKAAQDETRTSHALNQYNYKRLLEMIDSQRDGHYSEKEYLQAVHNVSYRDYLYRIIVKHASEWYYGKDDPLWKTYLDTLTLDAPQWKTYIEALIDNMTWMKKVDGMGPEPWHMHPVVFLSAFNSIACDCETLYAAKFKVTRLGTQYGPIYRGEMTLGNYPRWDKLIAQGKITLSEQKILIAMSENEGNLDALHSYDSEVITAGAMQKTVKDKIDFEGKGELSTQLAKFRDRHPDLYRSHVEYCGWSVEGSGSSAVIYYRDKVLTQGNNITSTKLKTLLRQGCNKSTYGKTVYNKPLAALLKVLSLPEYFDLQVLDFIERLKNVENKIVVNAGNKKIKDFVQSDFGRAVVLDHSVNRPEYVAIDFKQALENFHTKNPTVSLDPQTWGKGRTSYETKLLEEYKLTRRMTDAIQRFNSLKGKLCLSVIK
jgi:hypothetical protein